MSGCLFSLGKSQRVYRQTMFNGGKSRGMDVRLSTSSKGVRSDAWKVSNKTIPASMEGMGAEPCGEGANWTKQLVVNVRRLSVIHRAMLGRLNAVAVCKEKSGPCVKAGDRCNSISLPLLFYCLLESALFQLPFDQ